MTSDLSMHFHFAGRTYAVRITDEFVSSPRALVSVVCVKEPTDGPGWLERVQWPNDDELGGFFGLKARFFEAGEGENEALYAVGGAR